MKNYITIIFLLFSHLIFGQNNELFRIVENGKIGYINDRGETVINPKYLEAGEFSEGLAYFRINGQYGFINSKDEIIIPAIYDFVGSFQNGIVDVYNNNEVSFINKMGVSVLPKDFKFIRFIDKDNCVYTTINGKSGVYNLGNSSIIFESKNYKIGDFSNDLAIVTKKANKKTEYGVIDKKGNFIVNFGTYSTIKKFIDGYALIELDDPKNKDGNIDGAINTKGDLLFKRPYKNHSYLNNGFHNGFAVINLYKYWIPEEKGVISTSEKSYEGFIDLKGKVVFNDTLIKYVNDFSYSRAFIQDHERNYNVIDTNFDILNEEPFENVKGNGFINGYAIVKSGTGWGIIDINMNYVVKPKFDNIHEVGIINNIFFFGIDGLDYSELYGIKDLNGKTIVSPIIESFDEAGFKNGLLRVVINKRLTYLNLNGDIVWQERISKNKNNNINITHLNRGHFYAYSKPANSKDNSGGWSVSRNEPVPLKSNHKNKNKLVLKEDDFKLYIQNYSVDTIQFKAQDSRLDLKLQAKNKNGKWKDIEYLPSSWCGNSYHIIELPTNCYWQFTLPRYEGDFETLLRAELKYINPKTKKEKLIYSNEFNGSINPGQFWRKPDYTPRGIMDPYNN